MVAQKSPPARAYIRPAAVDEPPFCVRPVTGSHLISPPLGRVLGLWQPHLPFGYLSGMILGDLRFSCVLFWWDMMSSETDLPVVAQARAPIVTTEPLPGTFMGLGLDLPSDRLHDVMGLRAIQPKAAVVKVMSVPNSRCVRVIVPDDHLASRFHEILIHDMEDEEPPFVVFRELGCLRLDWPKAIFTFMARYQFELDQMFKECRERFGSTQSVVCTTCGKHIQQNLGKHIALYGVGTVVAVPGDVVYCLERYIAGLHRSYEKGS